MIAATLAAQTLAAMAILTLPAIAPRFAEALGVNPSLIGYQVSLVYAAAMGSTAFGGGFVRAWGACRTTQAALLLAASGSVLAMVPNLAFLFSASILLGLGYGLTNPAAAHLLVRFTPERGRNLIFSFKQTGVPLGGLAAALTAPTIAIVLGWPWALALVAVCAALLALALQLWRSRWDNDREPGAGFRQMPLGAIPLVWKRPPLRYLALCALCYAAVQLCVTTFTVTLLVQEAGYGLVQAGLSLSAVQTAGLAGRLFWGWLADRMGNSLKVLILLGTVMIASCLAVSLVAPTWPPALVHLVFAALGASAIGWNGVFLAEVARLSGPAWAGAATGGALFFTFAGVLLGPSLFASLYRLTGSYTFTFGLFALVASAGLMYLSIARNAAAVQA